MSMSRWTAAIAAVLLIALVTPQSRADDKKSAVDQRVEILRGLMAEYATVKAPLPRSRKPLDFDSSGSWDKAQWDKAGKELGPAARLGDLVQVTGVDIEKEAVILVINNGMKGKTNWKDHVQIGIGGVSPVSRSGQQNSSAPSGTTI